MSLTIPQRTALLAALVLVTVAVALPALGCPVCYGEAEGEIITGTKWSVAFLGALVYLLLGGVGGLVLVQRKRLRRMADEAADPHRGLKLVEPPAGGPSPAPSTETSDD